MKCLPKSLWGVVVGVLLVSAWPVLAQNQLSITDRYAILKTLVETGAWARAWTQCRAIVDASTNRDPNSLTGPEWFAIASARYYLTAEALDRALQAGNLPEEDAQAAQTLRDNIMAGGAQVEGDQPTQANVPKVQVVSQGQEIDLARYLVGGQTTIVDFYSEFCGPCRALSPKLEALVNGRPDLYLVKVDVNRPDVQGIDWQSPVSKQFSLRSLPFLRIYGPDKQLVAEGAQARTTINQWLAQEPTQPQQPTQTLPRVQIVGQGQEVDLPRYLTPGKTVIVDFFSAFCPPCMSLGPRLEQLIQKRQDLVLVKVDVNRPDVQGIDWQSPTAQQFDLHGLPHLKLYGPNGALISEGDPARQTAEQWLQAEGL